MEVNKSESENISQFADDLAIWVIGNDINEMAIKLNKRLSDINIWAKNLNLEFSPQKCNIIMFTRKRNVDKPDIMLNKNKLEYVDRVKYLGVIMDRRLTWKENIKAISKKNK